MTTAQIITLIIAILGVINGPLTAKLLAALRKTPPKPQ
jgi:uncharacterized membrane protein